MVKYKKIHRELSFSFVKATRKDSIQPGTWERQRATWRSGKASPLLHALILSSAQKKSCSPRCLPTWTKIRYLTNWSAVGQTYKIGLRNKRTKGEVAKRRPIFPQHLVVSPRSQHIQSLAIYFARGRRAISFLLLFEVAKLWNHKFHSRHADESALLWPQKSHVMVMRNSNSTMAFPENVKENERYSYALLT